MCSAALSQRKPASVGTLRGSCRVQGDDKSTPCTCWCVHYGLLCCDVWGYVCRSVSSLNNVLQPREGGGSF